jgi:hypothetical protein
MKILLVLPILLMSTLNTYTQVNYDTYGNPISNIEAVSHSSAGITDTSFSLADTLRLPQGYVPGSGQLSKDGLEYYLSLSENSSKQLLYVLRRDAISEVFGSPQPLLGAINDTSVYNEQPSVTADKKTIVFCRANTDSWTAVDLYIATRSDTSLPFDSVRSISELNSADEAEAYPCISPDGLRLYFTKGMVPFDNLMLSVRESTSDLFGPAQLVMHSLLYTEKSSCWLSNDEREIYFMTRGSIYDVRYAIRESSNDSFSLPKGIPSLNGYHFISGISLVGDELYLYNSSATNVKSILIFHRVITSVSEIGQNKPTKYLLGQNYPNPFNPSTTIRYQLPEQSYVTLKVFDVLGREVATLVDAIEPPGFKSINFNADGLSSGLYYYRLQADNYFETKKLILLR